MYLVTKWFGTFLFDKNGIKSKILFPKNPKDISKILINIDNGKILQAEKKIIKDYEITVNEKRLEKIGTYNPKDIFFKKIKIEFKDFGYSEDLIYKASMILTENKVKKKLKSEDLQVIQMINALDDLIQTSNLISERIECWSNIKTPNEKIKPFKEVFTNVNKEITRLEKQIEKDVRKIAPNTSSIIGPLISGRLISLAGGIERLATMPASTIQLLGAEKAFFRFKKEGSKPPKHGIIFQHPLINKAPRVNRGKIARILATTISIALKADVFTKRNISHDLKDNLNKRINDIKIL
jgi:nucleolar protein 56